MALFKHPSIRRIFLNPWAFLCIAGTGVLAHIYLLPGPLQTVLMLLSIAAGTLIIAVASSQFLNLFKNPFIRTLLFTQWTYWCMVGLCIWAQLYLPPGLIRTILTLSPIPAGILIIAAGIWQYQACDEYIRHKILSAATTTAVITALWTMAYSYLELVGLPRLSMMWVGNAGWLIFIVQMIRLMLDGREKSAS